MLQHQSQEGPLIEAAVAETPLTAPARAALRALARTSTAQTDAATVSRMRTPTVVAMAGGDRTATSATPAGVSRSCAPSAHLRGRHAIWRGACTSWTTGSDMLVTRRAVGIRAGAKTTMKGAATTAIPKPMEAWTKDPAVRATPRRTTVVQSVTGTRPS